MIHGVTCEVTLATQFNGTAVDPYGNLCACFTVSTEISRKDFDLIMNAVRGGRRRPIERQRQDQPQNPGRQAGLTALRLLRTRVEIT
jgi:hypothetical protein